jgi:hypothetical protein
VRYVREAGSDPSFLIKALSEASGELRRSLYGLPRPALLAPGPDFDEDWCLLGIAAHMRDIEGGWQGQLDLMLRRREPELRHVDMDDIPFRVDYEDEDEEEILEEFHFLRRRTSYFLWDIAPGDWERGGIHPYRGRITVIELARDMYQHDLEHLWQARRLLESMQGARA